MTLQQEMLKVEMLQGQWLKSPAKQLLLVDVTHQPQDANRSIWD